MDQNMFDTVCRSWIPERTLTCLPDTNPWKNLLLSAVSMQRADDMRAKKKLVLTAAGMQLPHFCGAIFTGNQGNGRHSTAEALACSIGRKKDLAYLRIYGAELDYEKPDEAMAAIACVVRAAEKPEGVCLLLDEPQHCRHSRMMQTRLMRLLEETKNPMYLLIVTDKPESVMPGLYRKLLCCHCAAPTLAERQQYLKSQNQWVPEKPDTKGDQENIIEPTPLALADFHIQDLAEETEGFSWSQLDQLMRHLRYRLYQNAMTWADEEKKEAEESAQNEQEKVTISKKFQNMAPQKRMELVQKGSVVLYYQEVEPLARLMRQQNLVLPVVTQMPAVGQEQNSLETIMDLAAKTSSATVPGMNEEKQALKTEMTLNVPDTEAAKPLPFGDTAKLKAEMTREIDKNDVFGLMNNINIIVDLGTAEEQDTE